MKKIQTGLIGAGAIADMHLEGVRALGFAQVCALAEENQDWADKRAEELSIPHAYDDYNELLNDPTIDVVHILLPNNLHFEAIKKALLAGKHVVAEKPLAMTSAEARELVEISKEQDVIVAINFHYRYFSLVQKARKLIAEGELGQVRLVHGSYLQDWLLYETDYNWRLDPKVSGQSRAMADIGSHWFDIIQYVLNDRVRRVFAHMSTVVPERKRLFRRIRTFDKVDTEETVESVKIETEDYAAVHFDMENGVIGTMAVSQVSPGRKNYLKFEIDGSQSAVAWNWERPNEQLWLGYRDRPNQNRLRVNDLKEVRYESASSLIKNVYTDIQAYMAGTFSKPGDYPTFEDGLYGNMIIDAVMRSSNNSCWVDVKKVVGDT